MEKIALWQILALSLYSAIADIDGLTYQIAIANSIFAGFFTGLVMGDVHLGLTVGATLQLMVLGVATYGGASVPNFRSAAIIGTAFAILTGQKVEFAIGLAVPVGILLTHMGTLARLANVYFQHKAEKYAEEGNTSGIDYMNILGMSTWSLSSFIPVFLGLYLGSNIVDTITTNIPVWLIDGLKVSGKILPAMGIAILMRYLPLRKYYPFYIVGFVLAAFLKLSLIGIALLGLSFAIVYKLFKDELLNLKLEGGDIDD